MLFMLIVKASANSEDGKLPSATLRQQMDDYNELLEKSNVRVMAKGLHPSSEGLRIQFRENGEKELIYGPFNNPNDIIAGFFLIEVNSKEEAINWALQAPDPQGFGEGQVELREVF